MAFIPKDITESIANEITCINQSNINKAIDLEWSERKFLFKVFFVTQDSRDECFFGNGIGTRGTYTLDVKDEHIFTMMKGILKLKGLKYVSV